MLAILPHVFAALQGRLFIYCMVTTTCYLDSTGKWSECFATIQMSERPFAGTSRCLKMGSRLKFRHFRGNKPVFGRTSLASLPVNRLSHFRQSLSGVRYTNVLEASTAGSPGQKTGKCGYG